jgi:type IV pilus assembly protein PilF
MTKFGYGWLLAACGAIFIAGCAGPHADLPSKDGAGNASNTASRSDLMTTSDEPDGRRRARIRLELASSYFEQGQTTVALDEVKKSLLADPNYADAYNLRGLVYMRLNDLPLAEDSFKRALALNPRDADAAHNYGWLLCQQSRYPESFKYLDLAIANTGNAMSTKSLMAEGLCQMRAGMPAQAQATLERAYQLDAGNPVTAYNLAFLLLQSGENSRAQFYIRRLNNSELANAESLWLGIRIEHRLGNNQSVQQLGDQLKKRFALSRQAIAYDKGVFNE